PDSGTDPPRDGGEAFSATNVESLATPPPDVKASRTRQIVAPLAVEAPSGRCLSRHRPTAAASSWQPSREGSWSCQSEGERGVRQPARDDRADPSARCRSARAVRLSAARRYVPLPGPRRPAPELELRRGRRRPGAPSLSPRLHGRGDRGGPR